LGKGDMNSKSFYLDDSFIEVQTQEDDIILEQENGNGFPDRVTISFQDLQKLIQEVRKRA
jgi:hypothetical protein